MTRPETRYRGFRLASRSSRIAIRSIVGAMCFRCHDFAPRPSHSEVMVASGHPALALELSRLSRDALRFCSSLVPTSLPAASYLEELIGLLPPASVKAQYPLALGLATDSAPSQRAGIAVDHRLAPTQLDSDRVARSFFIVRC